MAQNLKYIEMVPFGFFGMPRPVTATDIAGEGANTDGRTAFIQANQASALVADGTLARKTNKLLNLGNTYNAGTTCLTASYEWPTHKLVQSASMASLSSPTDRYFGAKFTRHNSDTLFDASVVDLAKMRGGGIGGDYDAVSGKTENSFVFSLDDVSASAVGVFPGNEASGFVYKPGSRAASSAGDRSVTAVSGTEYLLDQGYDKFTMPLYGGFDGLEIKEMAPLINNGNNGERTVIGSDVTTSYERYTIQRAIDTVADPEIVDMNLLLVPGVHVAGITDPQLERIAAVCQHPCSHPCSCARCCL